MSYRFSNAEPFVERCAEALLSQTRARGDYEILMVDNNSTDRSAALIRRFDRIRLLHAPRQGSYAARNQAIGEARGEIIAFTDADCLPEPDWLEQIACAMKEPSTILVLGDRRFATDSGILGLIAAYESEMCARIFSEDLADRYYAYTNNMAVRTFALQALGGFRTFSRGADSLFMRSILRQCGTAGLKYAPRAVGASSGNRHHRRLSGQKETLRPREPESGTGDTGGLAAANEAGNW